MTVKVLRSDHDTWYANLIRKHFDVDERDDDEDTYLLVDDSVWDARELTLTSNSSYRILKHDCKIIK